MSDTEAETPGTEEPDAEPVGAPESPGEDTADAETAEEIEGSDDEGDAAGEGAEDARATQAVTDEKELEKRSQRLDAENTRHAKRIGEIMDEAAVDLIPCPVCMDGIAGWVYAPEAQALPEEAQLRLRQLMGLSSLEGLKQAPFARRCPDCDGYGEVKTDSFVPGYETTMCESCKKAGWIRVGQPATNGHLEHPEGQLVTGPTVVGPDVSDPSVLDLRSRGFTVIPPMAPVPGT